MSCYTATTLWNNLANEDQNYLFSKSHFLLMSLPVSYYYRRLPSAMSLHFSVSLPIWYLKDWLLPNTALYEKEKIVLLMRDFSVCLLHVYSIALTNPTGGAQKLSRGTQQRCRSFFFLFLAWGQRTCGRKVGTQHVAWQGRPSTLRPHICPKRMEQSRKMA